MRRFQMLYLKTPEADLDPKLKLRGDQALARMAAWLDAAPYLVGQSLTCADISLLPYTRLAHEGGFDLKAFPSVAAWVARVDAELGL